MIRFTTVIFIVFFFYSCGFENGSDDFTIGDDFISSRSTVAVIDTFSANLSTIRLDSLPTSGTSLIWTGRYRDTELGLVTATSYFEIGLPLAAAAEKGDRFDSLVFTMNYSAAYFGDTVPLQQLQVFQVDEEIKTDEEGYLYNTSSFRLKEQPLGTVEFKAKPSRKGVLRVRMSDALGADLLEKMKSQDEITTLESKFNEYFRGMALVPGLQNSAVLGFTADTTVKMTLYLRRSGIESQQVVISFPFTSKETQFNNIKTDRTGTWIENIETTQGKIPSEMSGNRAFMQSGAGLLTRVDFPTMQRLVETDRTYVILKAELILVPLPGTYNNVELPREIVLYHSDKSNRVVSEIVGQNNSVLAAEFQVDKVFHQDSWYKFDITDFITSEIADAVFETDHGLLIGESSSVLGKSLNRIVFSDQNKTGLKPLLKLYILYYSL